MAKPLNVVIVNEPLVPTKKPRDAGDDTDEGKNSQRNVKVKLSVDDSKGTSDGHPMSGVGKKADKLAEKQMGGLSELDPIKTASQTVGLKNDHQPASSGNQLMVDLFATGLSSNKVSGTESPSSVGSSCATGSIAIGIGRGNRFE
jgi:hypothetical protein